MAFFELKQAAYAEIEARYACSHPQRELRHRVLADKRESHVTQCIRCGHTSNPIKTKDALAQANGKTIPEYDYTLGDIWRAAKSAEYVETYIKLKPSLRNEYEAYLASDAWKQLREHVILRSGNSCEICEMGPVEEVHHLTYTRIGNENLEDLLGVCQLCHRAIHSKCSA